MKSKLVAGLLLACALTFAPLAAFGQATTANKLPSGIWNSPGTQMVAPSPITLLGFDTGTGLACVPGPATPTCLVYGISITGAGDASAANQISVQASPGADAVKALAIQGIAGMKPIAVTGTFWQATQPVSGTFWQATQPVSGTLAISTPSFQSEGKAAAQASAAGNPMLNGCRTATAVPTASTDGQVQYVLCGVEGKQVFLPFAIKELMVRGAASSTDTSAHQLFAAAGSSVKNYATDLECTNSSATDSDITLNDSSSFSLTLKAGNGFMKSFQVPLVTAANTALNFTMGTGVSTVKCNAQGYTGP